MNYFYIVLFISFSWSATITGYIKNTNTGKSIPNANIIIKETGQGIASNPYGFFAINVEPGNYTLEVSVIGFEKYLIEKSINENIQLNIDLATIVLEYNEVQVQGLLNTRMGYESIDIINSSDIKSMNKESISDLLKNIKGVDSQFSHPNGRNVNVSIRGSSDYKPGGYNNRVLVLLDGFPILIPNSGSPDWSSLPLENLQRIELNNSAASTQYGHNSMGGVINLITDHVSNNTQVNLFRGSFGSKQIGIIHNKEYSNWSYGMSMISRLSNGHRYNADDKINRLQSFIKYNNAGRNYRFSYLLSESELGHPGFDLDNSNKYRRSNRLSQYVQLKGFYPISTGLSMSHSLFYNQFQTNYSNRNDIPYSWLETHTLDAETSYRDVNYGLRSEMIITKYSRWIFMFGYDMDWSQSDVDLLNNIYNKPSQITFGSFLQSQYSIGSGFTLNIGLRYDYRKTDPGNNFQKRNYTYISPKISLNYKNINESLSISYSKGFRAPSISELYLKHTTTYGLIVAGNPELLPENVNSFEIAYKNLNEKNYDYGISLFHNRYKDMIDFVYDIPTRAKNREGVNGSGVELDLSFFYNNNISFDISYSFLDMKDLLGDAILYRSKHKGKLFINIIKSSMKFSYGVNSQSKQFYEDFLEPFDYANGFPIKTLSGRIISECMLSKSFGTYNTSFKISNFFDKKYELIQNYTMPGRAWQFVISKTIK